MINYLEDYYNEKTKELKKRRNKARIYTIVFIIFSIVFVYLYIESVEKTITERENQTYEIVKDYYKDPNQYDQNGFTEETLKSFVNISSQVVNNGKSLLDSLLGYLTLIFSAVAIASLNYCFQLSHKIDEYSEKYTIEYQKSIENILDHKKN